MREKLANPVASKATRPSKRSQRTRRELTEAAIEILEGAGSAGLTVKAVTERAGMGHGTFYHHFDSTEDVLAAAVESSLRSKAETLWRRHAASEDKAWVIAHSLVSSLRALAEHPAIEPMIERPRLLADALGRAVAPFARADLEALIQTGETRRGLATRVMPYWAWMIIGALSNRLHNPKAAAQLEDDLVELTMRTIGLTDARIAELLGRTAAERRKGATND